MASLKDVRTRIDSVNSTRQITSAMKMVAASKLRKSQNAVNNMRPYAAKLNEILHNLTDSLSEDSQEVFSKERDLKKVLLVVITSNRGLCGAFNSNVIKAAQRLLVDEYPKLHAAGKVDIMTIGKKSTDYFSKKNYKHIGNYDQLFNELNFENALPIAEELTQRFADNEYDRIILIYNQFKSAATQIVTTEQLLPIISEEDKPENKTKTDYLFEPDKQEIVEQLIPIVLNVQFYKALLDSYAAEHGARMLAMSQATDNATELIKELKLQYNKARQAAITGEILEIVGGAEALKNG